jgi:hypothetical protein
MLAGDSGTLYALNDQQAVSYVDGETRFIGGTPVTFVNGVLQP